MVNVLRALVAVAGLGAITAGGVAIYNDKNTFDSSEYALDYVCERVEADCAELNAPEVRFGPYRGLISALGFYWHSQDPNSIYLDIEYVEAIEQGNLEANPRAWEVLVHETTHYVDRHLEITDGSSCAAETLGWHMGNTWLLDHGHYDMATWQWYERYDDCDAPTGG